MNAIKLLKTAAAATLLASAAAHATTTELLINGSFEANAQGNGSWDTYANLSGWTGGSNKIELRNNVAGTAADGVNFVELDTYANSSITQSISTVLNHTYTLTFQFQDRAGVDLSSQGLQVSWGGHTVDALTTSGGGWATRTYTLIGNGSSEALTFTALGTSDGLGTSLDKVSLTAAVPEPETYAMMLAGLGLMGFVARRRKQ